MSSDRGELLVNAITTPDGTYLESRHRHDYQKYEDTVSGELYVIDGGLEYTRRSVNKNPAICSCVYSNDPHEVIREAFKWGTYGRDADQPMKLVLLKDLTPDHIFNIIEFCKPQGALRAAFFAELKYRLDHNIEQPKEGSY